MPFEATVAVRASDATLKRLHGEAKGLRRADPFFTHRPAAAALAAVAQRSFPPAAATDVVRSGGELAGAGRRRTVGGGAGGGGGGPARGEEPRGDPPSRRTELGSQV